MPNQRDSRVSFCRDEHGRYFEAFPTLSSIVLIARASSSPTLLQRFGAFAGPGAITALLRSLRIRPSILPSSIATPAIVAFWHGGMLVPWYVHRHARAAALVSASSDGDVLAAVLGAWGIRVVRGSSSSGGSEALSAMVQLVADGYTVLITPDGPRGPAHLMKIGALVVAQRTGAPVVLCAPRYRSAWRLHSWDGFFVPKPFSRVDVEWSEPISIPRDCTGELLDAERVRIESRLRESMPDA